MERHRVTGHWKIGIALTLVTVILWGALPLALKILLDALDPYTLTWTRFLASALLVGGWLAWRRKLPRTAGLTPGDWVVIALCVLGLLGNYVLYVAGLRYVSPSTAQVVIQMAHGFVVIGALILFRERFSRLQWAGVAILTGGLGLFFHNRLGELAQNLNNTTVGVLIIVAAALTWAVYALAQKHMMRVFTSQQILLVVYVGSVLLLLPVTRPSALENLTPLSWALLVFACLNTLVAYGCYSEACAHLEASRVSALLVVIPLFTLGMEWAASTLWPALITQQNVTPLTVCGAGLVVAGSALAVLGRRAAPVPE